MECKFKVGDKVKVVEVPIELEGCVNEGSVGVITCIDDKIYCVKSDSFTTTNDKSYWFSKVNLNLANKQIKEDNSISSDGGSSDYYFTKLPKHLIDEIVKTGGIEIKDIARYVYDNDADAFNIIKAEKRIIENRKGVGKKGVTSLYDANKIVFFAKEQYEAILKDGADYMDKKEDNK